MIELLSKYSCSFLVSDNAKTNDRYYLDYEFLQPEDIQQSFQFLTVSSWCVDRECHSYQVRGFHVISFIIVIENIFWGDG
jgi:hypothetical protein